MRSTTAGELTVLAGAGMYVVDRVSVQNGSGTYKNLCALGSPAVSYLIGGDYDADIDQPVSQLTLRIKRKEGSLSLAPMDETSALNVLDDGTTYSPLLDPSRRVKWERFTGAFGSSPGTYKNMFEGVIDDLDMTGEEMVATCLDDGSTLVDTQIITPATFSGSVALETEIQNILDAVLGAAVVSLWTPSSPGETVTSFAYDREPLMEALQRLQQELVGWDLRYWYKADTDTWRLRLADPLRTKVVPDATLAASMYLGARKFGINRRQIRNRIEVAYGPSSSRGQQNYENATSVARFGRRTTHIELASNSPVQNATQALNLATNAGLDLSFPKADLELEMLPYWPVELFDLIRVSANAKWFTTDQDLSVVGIRHTLGEHKRTFLRLRGQPAGAYYAWTRVVKESPAPTAAAPTASVVLKSRQLTTDTLTIDGALGSPELDPLEYRTRVNYDDWSVWNSAPTLPQDVVVARATSMAKVYQVQTRQSDLQTSTIATITVPARGTDSDPTGRGDDSRGGPGGISVVNGRIYNNDQYDSTGVTPLIDSDTSSVMPDLKGSDGYTNLLGRRGVTTRAGAAAGAARGIVHDGETRRGDGGISDVSHIPATPVYDSTGANPLLDSVTGRVYADLYADDLSTALINTSTKRIQSTALGPAGTAMDDVETGGNRGKGGFSDTTGSLVATAKDSRTALVNGMGRVGVDTIGDWLDSATYGKTKLTALTSGEIDFSKSGVLNRYTTNMVRSGSNASTVWDVLSNVTDGGMAASTMADSRTSLLNNAGRLGVDTLDSWLDGATYARVAGVVSNLITPSSSTGRNRCRLTMTGAQSINNASETALSWDSEVYDVGSLHSGGAPTRITIPTGGNTGLWIITANIRFANNSTGYRYCVIYKNGSTSTPLTFVSVPALNGDETAISITLFENAPSATDYYEIFAYQSSGGALNINAASWFGALHAW